MQFTYFVVAAFAAVATAAPLGLGSFRIPIRLPLSAPNRDAPKVPTIASAGNQ
jgi:hypothetical protein